MEIFYELMTKHGASFLVSTNDEGVCEFSINGCEFAIHTLVNGEGEVIDFSFSAATNHEFESQLREQPIQEEISILSVKKVDERQKRRLKELNRRSEAIARINLPGRRNSSLTAKKTEFCAYRGSVKTPNGWICA